MCTYRENGASAFSPTRFNLDASPRFFAELQCECRNFALTKEPVIFRAGDVVTFHEATDGVRSGAKLVRKITHVLDRSEGLAPGYAALSLRRMGAAR